jgi:hypothetical protein
MVRLNEMLHGLLVAGKMRRLLTSGFDTLPERRHALA